MNNVDWHKILIQIAIDISTRLDLKIFVEDYILKEIEDRVYDSLRGLHIPRPNVAKIAGVVAFWVRKLKPFSYDADETASGNKFHALNELIAIEAGISICNSYKDDYSRVEFSLDKRLLLDWLHSLRFHSHSPHSSMFAFELLTTAPIP
jgi:hypothetical protein